MRDETSQHLKDFFVRSVSGRKNHLLAFDRLERELSEELRLNIRLNVFTDDAVKAYEDQWKTLLEDTTKKDRYINKDRIAFSVYSDAPEKDLSRSFNKQYDPYHFNLAIWVDGVLCGLAYGGHSQEIDRDYISVKVMEGNPDPQHPLKGNIAYIIDKASAAYAEEVGVSNVAHIGPFSQGARAYHESQGLVQQNIVYNPEGMVTSSAFVRKL